MAYETLSVTEPIKGVMLVTLSRPQASNALNTQMGRDLNQLWDSVAQSPNSYRCVVLVGAGEKAFCAGGDLKERNGMTDEAWAAQHRVFERMVRAQIDCPVPVIAAVNGAAYGGGAELVLAADFAYAAAHARFALTEVTLGIMPGSGGTQTLPRAIAPGRAKEAIYTGRPFSAAEALDWGMLNGVRAGDRLMTTVMEIASGIAANAPLAVRQAKQAIRRGLNMDLLSGMCFEIEAYNQLVGTKDRREGVLAFNERRKPEFRGS